MRLAAIFTLVGTLAGTPVKAQDAAPSETLTPLPQFNCASLIMATGAGDPSLRNEQLLGESSSPRLWRSTADLLERRAGPIALIERVSDGRDLLLMEGAPTELLGLEDGTAGHLGCLLHIVEFKMGDVGRDGEIMMFQSHLGSEYTPIARVPLLLLSFLQDGEDYASNLQSYLTLPRFVIDVPEFDPLSRDEPRVLEAAWFGPNNFLAGVSRFDENTARSVTFSGDGVDASLTPEVVDFVTRNESAVSQLLVFCGGAPCEEIYQAVASEVQQTDPINTGPLTVEPTEELSAGTITTEIGTGTGPISGWQQSELPAEAVPSEQTVAPTAGFQFSVRLNFVGVDGVVLENATESIAQSGAIECILSAFESALFMNDLGVEFPCDEDFQFRLDSANVGLRANAPGDWSLVVGGRALPPKVIFVELPPGQTGEACTLQIQFQPSDSDEEDGGSGGLELRRMMPVPGSIPVLFESPDFDDQLAMNVIEGRVRFELMVNNEADCGGPSRFVDTATAMRLTIPLVEGRTINRIVAHVAISNANHREAALDMGDDWNEGFGGAILNAVAAAHFEVGQRRGNEPWELTRAVLKVLDGVGESDLLLEVPASPLREGATLEFRSAVVSGAASDIGRARYNLSGRSIVMAVDELRVSSVGIGAEELVVTLLAPFLDGSDLVAAKPCSAEEFAALEEVISLEEGPRVRILVFPIVGVDPGDLTDANGMVPVGFQDPDGNSMGGMYRCTGLPDGLEIYPYYVEPWRSQATIPARYSTALSEQLSRLLSDIVN